MQASAIIGKERLGAFGSRLALYAWRLARPFMILTHAMVGAQAVTVRRPVPCAPGALHGQEVSRTF